MLIGLYLRQSQYIDQKVEENPLMDLENRKEYYKEFNIPQIVLSADRELLNLYFDIELEEISDPETGEKVMDWDKFWAMRDAITDAVPDNLKQEWEDYIIRNSTRIEQVRREVSQRYFKPYNNIWETVLGTYGESEQRLIKEFLYLENTGQKVDMQEKIMQATIGDSDIKLIANFRSSVAEARRAIRFANPSLDAWLFYWGRTGSFLTTQAEQVYAQIAKDTGRKV